MTTQQLIFFLVLAVVNSFVIIGWNKAAHYDIEKGKIVEDSKMIFWKLRYWSLKFIGQHWSKPIITCSTCMASLHSIYIYWPVMLTTPFSLLTIALIYPLYILMLAGVATLINSYA